MEKPSLPFITICMPVRNEENYISLILNDLIQQNYPNDKYEIIVADGISNDGTKDVVKKISDNNLQVKLYNNKGMLSSSGRNIGFEKGVGDIFLVIDGHCKISNKNLLMNMVECFQKSKAQCLGRPQPFIIPDEYNYQRAVAYTRASLLGHSLKSFIHKNKSGYINPMSVGCAYKKEVIEKIGFVDETFDACEDVEYNYRVNKAGFTSYFCPDIAVYYYPRSTMKELFKQMMRYGNGRSNLAFKHPKTLAFETIVPVIFVSFCLLGTITIFLGRIALTLYLSVIMLYITVITLESLRLTGRVNIAFSYKIITAFIATHIGSGLGFILKSYQNILKRFKNNYR